MWTYLSHFYPKQRITVPLGCVRALAGPCAPALVFARAVHSCASHSHQWTKAVHMCLCLPFSLPILQFFNGAWLPLYSAAHPDDLSCPVLSHPAVQLSNGHTHHLPGTGCTHCCWPHVTGRPRRPSRVRAGPGTAGQGAQRDKCTGAQGQQGQGHTTCLTTKYCAYRLLACIAESTASPVCHLTPPPTPTSHIAAFCAVGSGSF